MQLTRYYDEFLRYHEMATWQQENCNLGTIPYEETPYDDDLIKNVYLYDVVNRKYAGFTQILLDMWYSENNHPYAHKLSGARRQIVNSYQNREFWGVEEWLYIFFIHRLTGSGINYAKNPSGYHNSILLHFGDCHDIEDMREVFRNFKGPKYTSIGYQIAPFPKPKDNYSKGGDWFICEILPGLVREFANYMSNGRKSFRNLKGWLESYNQKRDFRVFRFQYAATLADIADFFPNLVDRESHFFYGKNAIECLNYMAIKKSGQKDIDFLDQLTEKIQLDTGSIPYNSEDIACDCIRWIENYINPKMDYRHLDLDKVFSSHRIFDHPFGRQKAMLELGLVKTFNGQDHPSDDKILKKNNLTIEGYQNALL